MKASVGSRIITRLQGFAEALENKEVISKQFTCRRVVLDLEPTPYNARLVRKTREILGASQAVFARFLGVSLNTIQAWEQGVNTPNAMACRFMDEIRRDPGYWRERFRGLLLAKRRNRKRAAKGRRSEQGTKAM